MKVLILGGVAAGTKVAAKLLRENRDYEVTILTKGKDISYAGCGLPYYVGDVIHDRAQLIVNTPEQYAKLTGAAVLTETEATAVKPEAHVVEAKDLKTGEVREYSYDKLVISTGASPFVPDIPGLDLDNIFVMRTPDDAIGLREAVESGTVKRAVIAGGGFIGLEVAENLAAQGVKVTVIDMAPHVLPNFLDSEMAEYIENKMADAGIMALTGTALAGVTGEGKVEKVQTSRRAIKADALILAIGIRPNTAFLEGTGIEMIKGTVVTDQYMQTNVEDIYAIRALLEGLCARWAAENITRQQLEEAQEILFMTRYHLEHGHFEQLYQYDGKFHEVLYRACSSPILNHVLRDFHEYIQNVRRRALKDRQRAVLCQEEHEAILDAIKKHDPDLAARLASQHIENAAANVIREKLNTEE